MAAAGTVESIKAAPTRSGDGTPASGGFLVRDRLTLERLLPGLDERLSEHDLLDLEGPASEAVELFRAAGGPGLLVPAAHSGHGASALEAVRVQRAVASRSPSLAVASTMHHFSVATLIELGRRSQGFEWMLLKAVATKNKLMSSGFAEGRPGQGILRPYLRAERTASGYRVSGTKKPCSLSTSMDLLTASLTVPSETGDELAVAIIPADSPGITCQPFWGNRILAGAQSHEVILDDVEVPEALVVKSGYGDDGSVRELEAAGLLWFELLITASYLGAASGLVERVLIGDRGRPEDQAIVATELEGAACALEGVARAMDSGELDEHALARGLFTRYLVQGAVARSATLAAELLGGMSFIRSEEVTYLVAACQALPFHPPSRLSMASPLVDYLRGEPLRVV
jgi:alkylation response protein AidB-like acyl-CoA dehydrogenase